MSEMIRLSKHARGAAALLLAALLLVGCGHLTSGTSGSGATAMNTSSPTQTNGPVTIATDHSAYNSADTIKVTVVNHLTTAIYAYDTQTGCSILRLEVQQGEQWAFSDALRCLLGRAALRIEIKPGATYTANIGGRATRPGPNVTLTNGTYRLVLRYFTGSDTPPGAPVFTEVDSAPLTISGSVAPGSTALPQATSQPNPS